ncbi:MAG TPA: DUF6441 family protein [Rhodocyclaceae bacterium]|nr:DUF6441 family protein [Rhodocyclaceae bacterium]
MKISIKTAGFLNPQRIEKWEAEQRQKVRQAVQAGLRPGGEKLIRQVRSSMQSSFRVGKAKFVNSMHFKVFAVKTDRLPSLYIGSKIPWMGIHTTGGTIKGKMLIPLLPEYQRMGPSAFRRVVNGLLRTGNAFFIQKNGKVILMAESIKENANQLRRFKRAERQRTGAKSIRRGQEIPIAVLVSSVTLRARFDLSGIVRSNLAMLTAEIVQQLKVQMK